MTLERRSGAPRLLEWTGERCVPWAPDVQVVYEHFHRYLWATGLVSAKRVLDLGSGEGFGSALLAGRAQSVHGIDIDERAVKHSQLNYQAPNLAFRTGSALDLGGFGPGAFDAVVAFEVLEHIEDQERVLQQVRHALTDEGLLLISTPDRVMYSEVSGQDNPYHERELTETELRQLLREYFPTVSLWGQRTMTGSHIRALDNGGSGDASFTIHRVGDEWRTARPATPLYMLAVASQREVEPPPAQSTLADYDLELVRVHERAAAEAEARRAEAVAQTADVARELTQQTDALQRELTQQTDALQQETENREAELRRRDAESRSWREERAALEGQIGDLHEQLSHVDGVTWRAFERARTRIYGRVGRSSRTGRAIGASLRAVGRVALRGGPGTPAGERGARFPEVSEPEVSLVMPVHSRADLTHKCLHSIAVNTEGPSYEVIVVDDQADDSTKTVLTETEGARVLVNRENLHFLRSMNRGCSEARGKYLVLLNNDVEVEPGWLTALVHRVESEPDVGVVTPKFLYPDRTLSEAGGSVFEDGSAWNYGRGEPPELWPFNFVREVDYGSAAALLVRADVWHSLDGFDERYAPAYYEDTDLCFAAREAGWRVMYEPSAVVIHHEGASSGTDLTSGVKRMQTVNQEKFRQKWRERLVEHRRFAPGNVRHASDRSRGPRALVVDHHVPMPDRDSGSVRMAHILDALQRLGSRVTFLPDNLTGPEPYTRELQGRGIEVWYAPVVVGDELTALGPDLDLVILSRPQVAARFLDLVRELAPHATVAYDTVDLHHIREERRASVAGDVDEKKAQALREIELALVRACDATFVVSNEEREYLEAAVPNALVEVLPNSHHIVSDVPGPAGRSGLLFVGSFGHPPNTDAARFLVESVMPLVWSALPGAQLTIVGPDPPEEVLDLASPAVQVAGWVPDLDALLSRMRLMVAPLRYGAGMKGKVTQSLAAGLPVVTTRVGAEGLEAIDGEHMLIADDPEGLAERIVRGYTNDLVWQRLSAAGQVLCSQHASLDIVRERLARHLPRSSSVSHLPPPSAVSERGV